jgi:NADH-quinone oxidoreductase subunit J
VAETLFYLLGALTLVFAVGVVRARMPLFSVLSLLGSFFCLAGIYLLLGFPFLAATQLLVYVGAIMVLFLFVIMLLGAEALPKREVLPWQKPLAIGLAIVLAAEATFLFVIKARPAGDVLPPGEAVNTMENLRALGLSLFRDYLLPFEVTSILLLVAMVGAIVLTNRQKEEPE